MGNGVLHIVGHHHGGQAVFGHDAVRELQHLGGGLGVEGGGVLVQQQELGLLQGGHQQRQRLPLTAGEQPYLGGQSILQPQTQWGQQGAVLLPLGVRDAPFEGAAAAAAGGQRQIFLDPHITGGAHHGVLEYPAQIGGTAVLRLAGDILTVQQDGAAVHGERACHSVEHGGFSRAVAADDGDEIAVMEGQRQVVQRCFGVDCAGEEGFGNMF